MIQHSTWGRASSSSIASFILGFKDPFLRGGSLDFSRAATDGASTAFLGG
jgi:hypothetical protein